MVGAFWIVVGLRLAGTQTRAQELGSGYGGSLARSKIKEVQTPGVDLAGRGLAARIESGTRDLQIIVLYFPPKPLWMKKAQAQHTRTVSALTRWLVQVLASTAGRALPIVFTDLNSQLQQTPGIDSVGPCSAQTTSPAGIELAAAMHDMEMVAVNTFVGDGSPTYFGKESSSQIDFCFVPRSALCAVGKVQMC